MGNNASTHRPTSLVEATDGVDDLPPTMDQHVVLSHYAVEHRLFPGSGRMMRSYQLKHKSMEATAVVKAMWVDKSAPNIVQILQEQAVELQRIKAALAREPHVAPFLYWDQQTEFASTANNILKQRQPVYLVRSHVYTTLSDRLASRPFYTHVEKLWIAHQLLRALEAMHSKGVCHGFVTTENVGLTSWNWVVLLDIASYKAHTQLPDDDPSEYLYYFQDHHHHQHHPSSAADGPTAASASTTSSSGKTMSLNREKRCYVAPERFRSTNQQQPQQATTTADATSEDAVASHDATTTAFSPLNRLTPAMDMFSAGCVLMETFLNGERALDLGDLMEYRKKLQQQQQQSTTASSGTSATTNMYMPPNLQQKLTKIESSSLRAACRHMLHLDPRQRLSARAYLERLQASETIPAVMEAVLEPLFQRVAGVDEHEQQGSSTPEALTPDARLALAAAQYDTVLWETVGVRDVQGTRYFQQVLGKTRVQLEQQRHTKGQIGKEDPVTTENQEPSSTPAECSANLVIRSPPSQQAPGQSPVNDLFAETEALLKKLEALTFIEDDGGELDCEPLAEGSSVAPYKTDGSCQLTTPARVKRSPTCRSSLLIYLQLVLSNIRHVQRPASKLVALQLLERLARHSADETRLQRMVPVTVSLLQDQDSLVRTMAIQVLTQILSRVESFPPSDSKLFPQYIFKRVAHLITDPSLVVRLAFANSIAILAETAMRFLDISHAVRLYEAVGGGGNSGGQTGRTENSGAEEAGGASDTSGPVKRSKDATRKLKTTAPHENVFTDDVAKLLDGGNKKNSEESSVAKSDSSPNKQVTSSPSAQESTAAVSSANILIHSNYQEELACLHETVSRWVFHITTDQSEHSSPTKRALLQGNLSRLCAFFGSEGVMAFILPQILAFLNDRKDCQLRAALFRHLPAVCRVVGRAATEHFVLPCLETGLVDGQEHVICAAIVCLGELIQLGLLSRSVLIGNHSRNGLLKKYSALLVHPSEEIRHGAVGAVNAACSALGSPDSEVYVGSILHPFLRFQPSLRHLETLDGMELCLYPPLTRQKFEDDLSAMLHSSRDREGDSSFTPVDGGAGGPPCGPVQSNPAASMLNTASADIMEQQSARVKEYLHMLGRHKKPPVPGLRQQRGVGLGSHLLKNGIEGSLKLAQNIKFPRQDAIGAHPRALPAWYSALRDKLHTLDCETTETSAIRSVAALGQIYGLSIMAASESPAEHSGDAVEETIFSEDHIQSLAHSIETRVVEAVCAGEWGAETYLHPVLLDTSLLITKLKALQVPPLPPRLGDLTPFTPLQQSHPPAPRAPGKDPAVGGSDWRPKADTLLATSSPVSGHKAAVVRIAVSLDQSFFVTGSYDGTCRVWEMSQIESCSGVLDSSINYRAHSHSGLPNIPRINDLAMVEGSHSVVSAASNGTVHVWRVDLVSSAKRPPSPGNNDKRTGHDRPRVVGTSTIRDIDPVEGEVLAVSHFNSPSSSIVTFATQKGIVHSWDLRCANEPFVLKHGPDIGYLTSMALGTDRNWILTGTSRGFLALWDLRFHQTVKLWHHSRGAPITRLATSYVPPPQMWGGRGFHASDARPFVFASGGPNECAMFDITTGACRECFRTVGFDGQPSNAYGADFPTLKEVPISSAASRRSLMTNGLSNSALTPSPVNSINAMCGSIGVSEQSYLITGGGDCRIRFWDFASPSRCYVVSGQPSHQPRPSYEKIDVEGCGLMLCRQAPSPSSRRVRGALSAKKLANGLCPPENHHTDSILDLKIVNNALLSASRDGTVKVWK